MAYLSGMKVISPQNTIWTNLNHWKDWLWNWNSSTLATSWEELTHWKRPWCWEGLGAGGEGGDRGWDGWMASPTRWAWVWVNFGSWRWTGRPGVLRFLGSQSRTRLSDWTELTDTAGQKTRQRWQFWAFQKILCERTATQGANGTGIVYVVLSHLRGAYESASFRLIT